MGKRHRHQSASSSEEEQLGQPEEASRPPRQGSRARSAVLYTDYASDGDSQSDSEEESETEEEEEEEEDSESDGSGCTNRSTVASRPQKHEASAEDLEEESGCDVCNSNTDADQMLVCDGCSAEYHIYCLRPKLVAVPDGDWFCPPCTVLQRLRSREKLLGDEVEKILATGTNEGRKCVLVKWKCKSHIHTEWVDRDLINNGRCPGKLSRFIDKQDDEPWLTSCEIDHTNFFDQSFCRVERCEVMRSRYARSRNSVSSVSLAGF